MGKNNSGKITNELMAYDLTKKRLGASRNGNPLNLVGLLIYNISNTGKLDREKRQNILSTIDMGERVTSVDTLQKGIDIVDSLYHTHLTRTQVSNYLGHKVNLDRTATMVEEEYERLGTGRPIWIKDNQ